MVEAALIVPLVILSIVAVICITETLYSHVDVAARLHLALNDSAGEYSETYEISPDADGDYSLKKKISKVKGSTEKKYHTGGILREKQASVREDSAHVLNEKRHIRVSDHVRD